MPVVSVVIPTYGHAEYILQTLDSVFAQTYSDYEVIVVNDGSPDNTAELLAPLVTTGKIRYFEQPNQGVASARNFGITQSRGRYIALIDDDDLWPEDKLCWQVNLLDSSNYLAVGGSPRFIGDDGQKLGAAKLESGKMENLEFDSFFDGNPFRSPGQVVFRREAYEAGVSFDPSIWGADDLDFWMGLAEIGRVIKVDKVALEYRVHDSNASRNKLQMLVNCQKVIKKRLRGLDVPSTEKCQRKSYRWLFNYLGKVMIWEARETLISRRPRALKGVRMIYRIMVTFAGSHYYNRGVFNEFKHEMMDAFVVSLYTGLRHRLRRVAKP